MVAFLSLLSFLLLFPSYSNHHGERSLATIIDMENRYLNDKKDNSKIDGENNSGPPSGLDYPEDYRAEISVYLRTPWAIRLQSFVRDNIFA